MLIPTEQADPLHYINNSINYHLLTDRLLIYAFVQFVKSDENYLIYKKDK